MSNSIQYRDIFFAFHGPGPYECYHCNKIVYAWWDTDDESHQRDSLNIHHIDEDHDNNCPENLAPVHAGCHTALHRLRRPLVAKGSNLPDRWKERISAGVARRMQEMTDDERAVWNVRVRTALMKVNKDPVMCNCGAGPFLGQHGLGIHQARLRCQATGETRVMRHQRRVDEVIALGHQPLMCECGAGPFKSQRGLDIHRYHGRRSSRCAS